MAVVAFCPTENSRNPFAFHEGLLPAPFIIDPPAENARWISHVAAFLAPSSEPLILVFHGASAVHAPALGFSRRSLRRPAIGYVLIDPVMPTIGGEYGDWPDAPVTVIITKDAGPDAKDAALQSRLRGWTVTDESLAKVLRTF